MDINNIVNDIVSKISDKYRTGLRVEVILKAEINNLKERLNDPEIIHKNFLRLSDDLKEKEKKLLELTNYDKGISEAREIVMSFWEENKGI